MRLSTISVACLVVAASCCSYYYVDGWIVERCTRGALVGGRPRESSKQQHQLFMGADLLPGQMRIRVVEGAQRLTAVARLDIKEKDVLLSFPFSDCITVEKAGLRWKGLISAKDLRTGSLGLLALYILSEVGLWTRSRYHDYFVTLPEESPGILSWNEASLVEELVQSTTRKVSSQLDACSRDIEFVQQVLDKLTIDERMKILPVNEKGGGGGGFTAERFRWALGIVKSRYVVLNQQPAIVPGE